jgi:hypothetical protein
MLKLDMFLDKLGRHRFKGFLGVSSMISTILIQPKYISPFLLMFHGNC